jgi:hypothetical protein
MVDALMLQGEAGKQQEEEEDVFHDGPSGPGAALLQRKLGFKPLEVSWVGDAGDYASQH